MIEKQVDSSAPWKLKDFVRTLSYREFVTIFSLVLAYYALDAVVDFYSGEPFFRGRTSYIGFCHMMLLLIIQHVFYKADHNRPNTFLARGICDYAFFIVLFLMRWLFSFFGLNSPPTIDSIGGAIALLIGFAMLIALFEGCVAILKRLLYYLKWQIL